MTTAARLLPFLLSAAAAAAEPAPDPADDQGLARLRAGSDVWQSIWVDGRKVGWEHRVVRRDGPRQRIELVEDVHVVHEGRPIDFGATTSVADDAGLALLGYEFRHGGEVAVTATVADGRLRLDEAGHEPRDVELPPDAINSYGLSLWAVAMPLRPGAERPVRIIGETDGKAAAAATLRVGAEGRIERGAAGIGAWPVEVVGSDGVGNRYWVGDERRLVRCEYGGPVCEHEPSEASAKDGVD